MSQTTDRTVSTFTRDAVTQARARTTSERLMDEVLQRTMESGFDIDAFHVMDQRDSRLLQDEILGGPRSSKFVYDFEISGQKIRGISAIGARELATYYKGIRHRIVTSTRKVGSLFVFTTYPHEGTTSSMHTTVLPELKDEPDGYEAVVEIEDIKSGNKMMAAKFESQWEWSSQKSKYFEKPHFATIAQSKAQRNGILMVIPQSVQLQWMEAVIADGKHDNITRGVLAEKRDGVLRYCTAQGIPLDRDVLNALLLEQIMGLSDAARTLDKDAFLAAAIALRLAPLAKTDTGTADAQEGTQTTTRGTRRRPSNAPEGTKPPAQPPSEERQTPNPTAGTQQASGQPNAPADPNAWREEVNRTHPVGVQESTAGSQTPSTVGTAETTPQTTGAVGAQDGGGEEQSGGFEAWLTDATGRETTREPFTDPVAFAQDLRVLCLRDPDAAADILDVNAGAIDDCMEVSEEARRIIEAVRTPSTPDGTVASEGEVPGMSDAGPYQPPLVDLQKTGGGKPHWPNYIDAALKSLGETRTQAEADAWMERNKPTYMGASISAETRLDRFYKLHVGALKSGAAEPEDATETKLRPIRGNLAACQSGDMVITFFTSPIIARTVEDFQHDGRDMRETISGMFADRYHVITGRERAFEFPR